MSYLPAWQNVITYRQIDAENDPNDEAGLRLLVHCDLSKYCFPTKTFGCATLMEDEDCNSIQEVDVNDAS
jgi:hypothetical protein